MGSVLQDARTQGEVIVKMADNLVNDRDPLEGIDFELEPGAKAIRVPYQPITIDNLDVAKETYAE
jgi:methyl-galactoside transport system substrate-binding protein